MDETGHSKDELQKFNGMVGLITKAENWEYFEREWKRVVLMMIIVIIIIDRREVAGSGRWPIGLRVCLAFAPLCLQSGSGCPRRFGR